MGFLFHGRPRAIRLHSSGATVVLGLTLLALRSTQTAAAGDIVISQIYGGGGNVGAPHLNDFIELFNRGTNVVNVTGWSVQYASASGSVWQATPLAGDIAPGGHFLVQQGSGGTNGQPLPASDAIGTILMGSTAGKVALVLNSTPLDQVCPTAGGHILDLVGYGTTAGCFEGGGRAPAPGNAIAIFRASDGCADTDDNSADFFAAAPAPRNSSGEPRPCSTTPPLPVALHSIQGSGQISPLIGRQVLTTTNVVIALRNDGFFIQARAGEHDADPNTSEGLFVFTPAGVPAAAAVGNAVAVGGIIEDRRSIENTNALSRTRIINPSVALVSAGNPLPPAVLLTEAELAPGGPVDRLERFESMRVRVEQLTVVGATDGFVIEESATGISAGVFFGVLGGTSRPFREAGIPLLDPLPAGAPLTVPRFDTNPERLRVDSNAQPGAGRIEVTSGAHVGNLTGVLDFDLMHYTLLPDPNTAAAVSGIRGAIALPLRASNELAVASFNLQRFFDAHDDPATDDPVLTPGAFAGRLHKASLVIRTLLRTPDILGVEEVENLTTLESLAAKINADTAALGAAGSSYAAWLAEGNDIGGIDIGFLVNTSRVAVVEVSQVGKAATYVNPRTGQPETLHDRPPLVLRVQIPRTNALSPFSLTLLLVHLRSLNGVDDPTDGSRIRAKRRAQAEFVANWIQQQQAADPSERILCLGDFNAYSVNDGYVDVLGTIRGRPASSNEVTLASADLVEPDLDPLLEMLSSDQRYSYVFEGNAQAIDHLLVNQALRPFVARFAFARCGADFPESWRSNTNRVERLSDHDAPAAYLSLNLPPRVTGITWTETGQAMVHWSGEPGAECVVEISDELMTWAEGARRTNDAVGAGFFLDESATPSGQRFYRVQQP